MKALFRLMAQIHLSEYPDVIQIHFRENFGDNLKFD